MTRARLPRARHTAGQVSAGSLPLLTCSPINISGSSEDHAVASYLSRWPPVVIPLVCTSVTVPRTAAAGPHSSSAKTVPSCPCLCPRAVNEVSLTKENHPLNRAGEAAWGQRPRTPPEVPRDIAGPVPISQPPPEAGSLIVSLSSGAETEA